MWPIFQVKECGPLFYLLQLFPVTSPIVWGLFLHSFGST